MMLQPLSPVTAILLATACFINANACVCYVGEEPNSIKGEPSLKLLPDQNPCECREFRPGGVNSKQQAKPYEVTFGKDGHPEGWSQMDCIHEPRTTSIASSPDTLVTLKNIGGMSIPPIGQSFQSYPVRIEFNLQSSTNDRMEINTFNSEGYPLCGVELDRSVKKMVIKIDPSSAQNLPEELDGSSHYLVTINETLLQFGRLGEDTALECQRTGGNSVITSFEIWAEKLTTVGFYTASTSLPRSYFQG